MKTAEQLLRDLSYEEMAKMFHGTYERLAPQFGYETRTETRELDLNSPNGKLMVATCKEIIDMLLISEIGDEIGMP